MANEHNRSVRVAGLLVACVVALGACDSDGNTSQSPQTTAGSSVSTVDEGIDGGRAWCEQAIDRFDSRRSMEPVSILDDLDALLRSDLATSAADEIAASLAASREALNSTRSSDGGYRWSSTTIVGTINDLCGATLEPFEFESSPQS